MVPCLDRAIDIGVRGRAAFVEGGLDGPVDDFFASVAQLPPLGDALARKTELLAGRVSELWTLD